MPATKQLHKRRNSQNPTKVLERLADAPAMPALPETGHCLWRFDSENCVLLGKFNFDHSVKGGEDEAFLLTMMERTDIAVVSEGIFNDKAFVCDLASAEDNWCHQIRNFKSRMMTQQDFDSMRLGTQPLPTSNDYPKMQFKHSEEVNGNIAMKIEDYIRYLHQFNSVQDNKSKNHIFTCSKDKGGEMNQFDVTCESLYMIDLDIKKLLPALFEDFEKSCHLPSLLPGGKHCMMNAVRYVHTD